MNGKGTARKMGNLILLTFKFIFIKSCLRIALELFCFLLISFRSLISVSFRFCKWLKSHHSLWFQHLYFSRATLGMALTPIYFCIISELWYGFILLSVWIYEATYLLARLIQYLLFPWQAVFECYIGGPEK